MKQRGQRRKFRQQRSLNQNGDTIVEVLIAMAIIAMVLAGAYVTSRASLTGTRDSQEHSEALKVAESQTEVLRSHGDYTTAPNNNFCFAPDQTVTNNPLPLLASADADPLGTPPPHYDPKCTVNSTGTQYTAALGGVPYYIGITYDSTSKVYTVNVRWNRLGGGGNDQVSLLYRLEPKLVTNINGPLPTNPCQDAATRAAATYIIDWTNSAPDVLLDGYPLSPNFQTGAPVASPDSKPQFNDPYLIENGWTYPDSSVDGWPAWNEAWHNQGVIVGGEKIEDVANGGFIKTQFTPGSTMQPGNYVVTYVGSDPHTASSPEPNYYIGLVGTNIITGVPHTALDTSTPSSFPPACINNNTPICSSTLPGTMNISPAEASNVQFVKGVWAGCNSADFLSDFCTMNYYSNHQDYNLFGPTGPQDTGVYPLCTFLTKVAP